MLHVDTKLVQDPPPVSSVLGKVWVMILLWAYGLWGMGGFLNFSANKVHGSPKPMGFNKLWVVEGMG